MVEGAKRSLLYSRLPMFDDGCWPPNLVPLATFQISCIPVPFINLARNVTRSFLTRTKLHNNGPSSVLGTPCAGKWNIWSSFKPYYFCACILQHPQATPLRSHLHLVCRGSKFMMLYANPKSGKLSIRIFEIPLRSVLAGIIRCIVHP